MSHGGMLQKGRCVICNNGSDEYIGKENKYHCINGVISEYPTMPKQPTQEQIDLIDNLLKHFEEYLISIFGSHYAYSEDQRDNKRKQLIKTVFETNEKL